MVSFTTAHRWNSLLCPPLGFLFNFTLLWLILHRTPKEMRVHSRILLQTGVIDCLLLASQCIGQMAFAIDQKTSCILQFFDGYFVRQFKASLTPLFLICFHPIWTILHHLSVFGIAIQFIYRYLVLNRKIKATWLQYLLVLLSTTLCIVGMESLIFFGAIDNVNRQPIDRGRLEAIVDFGQQPTFTINEISNYFFLFGFVGYALLFALTYTIICWCGWKMVRFVSRNVSMIGKLKELNRQLTKCLIILACLPMCFGIVSIIMIADIFFTTNNFQADDDWTLEWELYLTLTLNWLPVLNPLVTIYTNRPYRDALVGRFVRIAPAANG